MGEYFKSKGIIIMAQLLDAEVSFCSITNADGHKNGKHLLGVYVDKAFKKQFEKDFDKTWDENKTKKAKKPVYPVKDWFSKDDGKHDKKNKGRIVFWVNANASAERGITLKQCDECDFDEKDFGKIGTGSIIDLEYSLYYHNNEYGEMVLRSIQAVLLKKLVEFEGGDSLDGNAIKREEKSEGKKAKKDKKGKKSDKDEKPKKSKKDKSEKKKKKSKKD